MYERLARLKTPEDCEQFALNVEVRGLPVVALAARRRAVKLRAAVHRATSAVEREALEAVYALERVLFEIHRRKTRASQIWRIINRQGILPAVEYAVTRNANRTRYLSLVQMGMRDMAFEAVVLRHPEEFSLQALERSKRTVRLKDQEPKRATI